MEHRQLPLIPDERIEPERQEMVALAALPEDAALHGDPPTREMVESVRRFGILQPIVVLENGAGMIVAAGRRRIKAARAAGLERIPAVVYPKTWTPGEVIALLENEQRRPNPISDLRAIEGLLARGASEEEIVAAIGISKASLRSRLALQTLRSELREAAESGRIAVTVAESAARLSPDLQQELVEVLHRKGKVETADVREVRSAAAEKAVAALPLQVFQTPGVEAAVQMPGPAPEIEVAPDHDDGSWVEQALSRVRAALVLVQGKDRKVAGVLSRAEALLVALRAKETPVPAPAGDDEPADDFDETPPIYAAPGSGVFAGCRKKKDGVYAYFYAECGGEVDRTDRHEVGPVLSIASADGETMIVQTPNALYRAPVTDAILVKLRSAGVAFAGTAEI